MATRNSSSSGTPVIQQPVDTLPACDASYEGKTYTLAGVLYYCTSGKWGEFVPSTSEIQCSDGNLKLIRARRVVYAEEADTSETAGEYRRAGVRISGVAQKGPFHATDHIDANGNDKKKCTDGTEKITLEEARRLAVRECDKSIEVFEDVIKLPYSCFDHLNNVEVVDVDFPEQGTWIVVVRTDEIQNGNSEDGHAQVASIASDLPLYDYNENIGCEMMHPYRPQSTLTCSYSFENSLTNFVTFSNQTFVGPGDYIYLLDDKNDIIGTYTGSQLAGARLKIDSSKLTVKLESSNNKSEKRYYGFSVDKIEMRFGMTAAAIPS